MQIDNENLIAAVERRRSLWLASDKLHKNKLVKAALWREVAAEILPGAPYEETLELVQKRWKSLRDKFRRLVTAHQCARKSGVGTEDIEASEVVWPFYEQLRFLKDTMNTRPTSGNYSQPEVVDPNSRTGHYLISPAEVSERVLELEEWRFDCSSQEDELSTSHRPSPPSNQSMPSPQESVDSPALQASAVPSAAPSPLPHRKRQKRRKESIDDAILANHVGKLTEALQTCCETHDEHELFGLSLGKRMKRVPEEQQISLRIKLLQVFEEYIIE